MQDQTAFITKPKRTYRMRTVQCFRCGTNLQRQMVKPPVYCDECRADVSFYERHPEQVDPVAWHITGHRPYPDVRELSPVQEAAVAALAARSDTQSQINEKGKQISALSVQLNDLRQEKTQHHNRLLAISRELVELYGKRDRLEREQIALTEDMNDTEVPGLE